MQLSTVDLDSFDAADRLDAALRRDGFVQLAGHDVDVARCDDLREQMDRFFGLPSEVKQEFVVDDPLANRGYRARGSEALSYALGQASQPDLFEAFNCGHPDRHCPPLICPTPWPSDLPTFVQAAQSHLRTMAALANRIDAIVGSAIGFDDLAAQCQAGPDTMACIRYQRDSLEDAADNRVEPTQQWMGAHSDYTSFTILTAECVPGLEILTADGWRGVIPDPGALLMNVGDLLAMWTNDAWPSTVHRVPVAATGSDPAIRRTVAYFHYPDLDVVVQPLAGFGDPRYKPTTVADHLTAMLTGPKLKEPSTGASTLGGRSV